MAYLDGVYNTLQIQPDGLPTYVRLSQNENGRRLYFKLVGNETEMPDDVTVTISGTKPDGVVYSKSVSIADDIVLVNEDTQLTAKAGTWDAKIRLISGGQAIATGLVRFDIEADPVAPGSVPSSSELEGLVAEAQEYAGYAVEAAESTAESADVAAAAAQAAASSASSATNAAQTATSAASSATSSASSAGNSATDAQGYMNGAQTAAQTAAQKATDASGSASDAASSASAAAASAAEAAASVATLGQVALYFTDVPVTAQTGDIATVSNSKITADHVVAELSFSTPAAVTSAVTWTTSNGSLILNGTCTAATTATVVLVKKFN